MRIALPRGYGQRLVLERLHRVLAVVVVVQLLRLFTDYWWDETFNIVYGSLAVVAASELLFGRLLGVRLFIQTIGVLLMTVWLSPFLWAGWPASWRSWESVKLFFDFHVEQLHPFAEIAIGVVLVAHALAWIGSTRVGAIFVVIASILTLAVTDSFYPFTLWTNIAWVVGTGLVWLVVLHLRQLNDRHPHSWEHLAERPFELALPAILIIGVVLLTGIFVPRVPALLEDPYTIWRQSQGQAVPAFNGEGGVQISNPSRTSSSTLSGYGRDDRNLGGGFNYDYSEVMKVTTTEKSYWRGETKAVYTGKGWTDRRNPELLPVEAGEDNVLEHTPPRAEGVETLEVTQHVTVIRRDRMPVLFGAGPITSLQELTSGDNDGLSWNAEEAELRWARSSRVQTYSVVSQVALLDEAALRETVTDETTSSLALTPYLQLPDTLPERVVALALEQTNQADNAYDKAKALEQFLKSSFPYTNTPDLDKQSRNNMDFVDAFLFDIREGYCDYFSTAFVVMARSVGLPARWVKGYTSGFNADLEGRIELGVPTIPDDSGAGTYTVRNADAHSWAEVYFEGYGWIPFEPTSGFSVPQPLPEGEAPSPEPSTEAVPEPTVPEPVAPQSSGFAVVAYVVGGILAIGAAVLAVVQRERLVELWTRIRHRGSTPNQRIVREMEKLLGALRRRGLQRETNETVRESFVRWSGKFSTLKLDIDRLLRSFEQARYGQGAGSEQTSVEFSELAARIRKSV